MKDGNSDEIDADDAKIADIFNEYFIDIAKEIAVVEDQTLLSDANAVEDSIDKAI